MSYQRILYFFKAAETGSFSKAAAQIFISPQALAKQIHLLEEELGGKLFSCTSSGIKLTPLGEFALVRLKKVNEELDAAVSEIRKFAAIEKPCVNIGIFSSLPFDSIITPFITTFLGSFPQYQMNLNLVGLREGKQLIWDGKTDFLLTNTHEEDDWRGFRCMSFREYEAKIIISLLHPWAVQDKVTEEDMRRETLLKLKMNPSHYTLPAAQSFYGSIPCKNVRYTDNFDTMYALLLQGDYFAVFPMAFANMDRARIMCFDYPGRTFLYHTALIYNPDSAKPGIKDIAADICEEFNLTEVQ